MLLHAVSPWGDGLIWPDSVAAHRLGVWTIAVLAVGLLAVLDLAVPVETYASGDGAGRRCAVRLRYL